MTTKTTLRQNCTTVLDGLGSSKFQIENTITLVALGDLPGPSIFVFQLVTATEPKNDVFLRIGSIQDITNTPTGRDAALITGSATYLSTGFTVRYDDVSTATAAKQLIQSRVDQLIADWRLYNAAFVSPDLSTYPLQDAGLVAAKKAAYSAAKTAKAAADAAVLAMAADLTVKQAAATAAAEKQVHYLADSTECVAVKATVVNLAAAETSFRAAAQAFLAAVNAAATLAEAQAATTAFTAAVTLEATALQAPLQALSTSLTASCSSKAAAAGTAAGAAAIANAAIGAAQRNAILAQQTATTAQTTLETALSEAVAVCPTFDPAAA